MNQNAAGAVLLLIIAAGGFVQQEPAAWMLAALTAALAFVSLELRTVADLGGSPWFSIASVATAIASWVTTGAAFIVLAV